MARADSKTQTKKGGKVNTAASSRGGDGHLVDLDVSEDQLAWRRFRMVLVGLALVIFCGALIVRAYKLQVDGSAVLSAMAEKQHLQDISLAPKRGTIRDRHGSILAASIEVDSVWANPREIRKQRYPVDQAARLLAAISGVERERLLSRLSSDRYFVWIKRQVTPSMSKEIRALKIPGVGVRKEPRRYYPNGSVAAHVLGFVNIDGKGIEGVELALENKLRGPQRKVPALLDRRGHVVFSETLFDDEAISGQDLPLTIDTTLQWLVEKEIARVSHTFEATGAHAVMMNPHTGEILALANYPTYDPNKPGRYALSRRRNRAIADRFEPGSSVKQFTVAAALAQGAIGYRQLIDCEGGEIVVDEFTIHDTHPFEQLNPEEILVYSSNIGASKIGAALGQRRLYHSLQRFGFGAKTGVSLPGETSASLRHYDKWFAMDAATIPFGQGMSVTTLQLATAMSVIANGGVLMKPQLVKDNKEIASGRVRRVIPREVARSVSSMLVGVASPGGTGELAAVEGYAVAGKTGTAQKAKARGKGYDRHRWVANFVGFLPAEKPAFVLAVVVDEPHISHYGGTVAATAFRRIAKRAARYLGLPSQHSRGRLPRITAAQRKAEREKKRSEEVRHANKDAQITVGNPAPDLTGLTRRAAQQRVRELNLATHFEGSGVVYRQIPAPGKALEPGDLLTLWLVSPADLPAPALPNALERTVP